MAVMKSRLLEHRHYRFVLVGLVNAAISFGVLNIVYYTFDQSKITSSIIATSCALAFSFVMNRNFVFGDKTRKAYKQIPAFVLVTVSGSLIVLNLVYVASLRAISGNEGFLIELVRRVTGLSIPASFIDINVSTAIGACAALFWNYFGYKWFVFKGKKNENDQQEATISI
jgi:putative flippase GtrA